MNAQILEDLSILCFFAISGDGRKIPFPFFKGITTTPWAIIGATPF